LARGYAGAADKNRDNRLEPAELFGYLQEAMGEFKGSQTPELFLPDNRPPRLSEEAKAAIRKLATDLRKTRVDLPEAENDYAVAVAAAGKEIEPRILYGLLLMKNKQRDPAQKQFDAIRSQHPELFLTLQSIAWVSFEKRAYQSGVDALAELVSKVPKPKKPSEAYPEPQQQVFLWAGQLREYVAMTLEKGGKSLADSLSSLDVAVARQNADARRLYEEGRAKSRAVHVDFERQIATAESAAVAASLRIEGRTVTRYVEFPYDEIVQQVLDGMER
jgi:hypothetical protein